jgi:hypothetical protein
VAVLTHGGYFLRVPRVRTIMQRCSDKLFPPASIARAAHRAAMSVVAYEHHVGRRRARGERNWRHVRRDRPGRGHVLFAPQQEIVAVVYSCKLCNLSWAAQDSTRSALIDINPGLRDLLHVLCGHRAQGQFVLLKSVIIMMSAWLLSATPHHTHTRTHALTSVNACSTLSVLSLSKC